MVILFAKYCPVTNEPSFSQSGILIKVIPCSWVLQAYVSEALQILKELGERFTSSININKLKKKGKRFHCTENSSITNPSLPIPSSESGQESKAGNKPGAESTGSPAHGAGAQLSIIALTPGPRGDDHTLLLC